VLALNPPLNSSKPVTAACTNAVVAILVESSPEAGVGAVGVPPKFNRVAASDPLAKLHVAVFVPPIMFI